MILGLSNKTASELSAEFREGNIKKEYIARCKGEFPACALPFPDVST
jgi:23S rRNA-/tRNA-specific pseudouridylate synthase